MGRPLTLAALGAAALSAAACGGVQASQIVMPDAVPLAVPAAPSRVVVPAPPEPVAAPPPETSAPASNPPASSTNPSRPRQELTARPQNPPATPPVAPAPAATPAAPTPLETSSNPGALELSTRGLISSAEKSLDKIDVKSLSADGLAQYQTAKRFLTQAENALKVKNVVYAFQLADKANTIATLLR